MVRITSLATSICRWIFARRNDMVVSDDIGARCCFDVAACAQSKTKTILFEERSTNLSQSTAAKLPSARAKMMPSFSGHDPLRALNAPRRTVALPTSEIRSFMPAPESASQVHFAESSFPDRIGFAAGQRKNRTAFLASGENAAKLRCCMSQAAFSGPVRICESRNCGDSRDFGAISRNFSYFRLYGEERGIRTLDYRC
jgi:hypothetical protein